MDAHPARTRTAIAKGESARAHLSRAGLPRFRLYDLRHTFATHLLELGAPITYVAAQLGYAKPTTTLAHYAHWIPRGDKGWVDRLAEARQSGSTTKAPGVGHDATRN